MVSVSQTIKKRIRVGRRRTIVIPKYVAEKLGIDEGSILEMEVSGDSITLKPILSAVDLALRGRKYVKISIRELEKISVEEQRRLMKK